MTWMGISEKVKLSHMGKNTLIDDSVLIVMPTINHAEIVEEWLRIYVTNSKNYRFHVHVLDSSIDNKTKEVCDKYSKFVTWERYGGDGQCPSLKEMDDKVVYGFQQTSTDYVWLTSDARVPNIDICYAKLKEEINKQRDVIHFFCLKSKMNQAYVEKHQERSRLAKIKEDDTVLYDETEVNELFRDFFWSFSTYGITVVKSKIISECNLSNVRKNTAV